MDATNNPAAGSAVSHLAPHNAWCFPRSRALTAAGSPDGEPTRARVGVEGRGGGVKRGGTGADNGRRSGEQSLSGDDGGVGAACRRQEPGRRTRGERGAEKTPEGREAGVPGRGGSGSGAEPRGAAAGQGRVHPSPARPGPARPAPAQPRGPSGAVKPARSDAAAAERRGDAAETQQVLLLFSGTALPAPCLHPLLLSALPGRRAAPPPPARPSARPHCPRSASGGCARCPRAAGLGERHRSACLAGCRGSGRATVLAGPSEC